MELRLFEVIEDQPDQAAVSRRIHSSNGVAEILFDQTFLALRRTRQHRAEFARGRKLRIRNARDVSSGIHGKLNGFGRPPVVVFIRDEKL